MPGELRAQAPAYLTAALTAAVLIGLAIGFVDRPLSTWSHQHLRDIAFFVWLTRLVEPFGVLAGLGLAGAGIAAACGWRPGPWGRLLIACCLAVLVGQALKEQLKFFFGRTWPETWTNNNPSWIANGVFTFAFLHGGQGWSSFPSGHTTAAASAMAVLWLGLPQWRWIWGGFVAVVVIGLLGANYHWLSDAIAGGFLGAAVGRGMVALVGGPRELPGDPAKAVRVVERQGADVA